jgi:hypothetical protein
VKSYSNRDLCNLRKSNPPAIVELAKSVTAGYYACTFMVRASSDGGIAIYPDIIFNVRRSGPNPGSSRSQPIPTPPPVPTRRQPLRLFRPPSHPGPTPTPGSGAGGS